MTSARHIGILTLLNQVNYGGVLQAYALQRVLRNKGYAAEVVDYWLSPRNALLNGYFFDSTRSWLRRLTRATGYVFSRGPYYVWADIRRRRQTIRFIREHVARSATAYQTASALSALKGYDCLVVGSDQVWNYEWHGRPNPFLLGQMEASTKRVSYAASFGFQELPGEFLKEYQEGLNRFSALSVRETEGVDLVRKWTGREAQWVLDPTLLLPEGEWRLLIGERSKTERYVFCYWLGDLRTCVEMVAKLSKQRREHVLLYVTLQQLYGRRTFGDGLLRLRLFFMPRIHVRCAAGPKEFIADLAHASAVVSDSFHSLMFSCIFRKPVKIFISSSPKRAAMGARMRDFATRYTIGDAVEQAVPDQAFEFSSPDYAAVWREIEKDRSRSLSFLEQSLFHIAEMREKG